MKISGRPAIPCSGRAVSMLLCLCGGLVAAQSVQAATLTPTLTCISDVHKELVGTGPPETIMVAHLGYVSTYADTVSVPVGLHNFFLPGTAYRGQPTDYKPGRHDDVFSVRFNQTRIPIFSWVLAKHPEMDDPGGTALRITNNPDQYCNAIEASSPAAGRAGQTVTLNITGKGFDSGAAVELTHAGVTLPASIVSVDKSSITATLAISDSAPAGLYDLQVRGTSLTPLVLPDAFRVSDGPSAVKALARLSSGVLLVGTAASGIYRSTDGGATWTQVNAGLADLHITALVIATDGSAIYAGTAAHGVFRSVTGGQAWAATGPVVEPHIHSLLTVSANPLVLFAGTDKGVYKTIDGGQSWQPMPSGLP